MRRRSGASDHTCSGVEAGTGPAGARLGRANALGGDAADGGDDRWVGFHGRVLHRYARDSAGESWREVGSGVPVMVGRSGLGWGMREAAMLSDAPIKHEGDGRAPAGFFPVDTAFGFAPADSARWVRLAYAPLLPGSECVDDGASVHYNTIVDRNAVALVDWTSAEHMRLIDQYKLGAVVGYNAAPPVAGRGSCIFLHIWAGAGMPTTGCTSMAERDLTELLLWLDPARMPVLVQLPEREYAARRAAWRLP
jgi:Uncharacterized protein conserved in bacteria